MTGSVAGVECAGYDSLRCVHADTIISALPPQRQVMLYTATALSVDATDATRGEGPTVYTRLGLRTPVFTYTMASSAATVARLEQTYVLMPTHVRHAYLVNVLRSVGFVSDDDGSATPRSTLREELREGFSKKGHFAVD